MIIKIDKSFSIHHPCEAVAKALGYDNADDCLKRWSGHQHIDPGITLLQLLHGDLPVSQRRIRSFDGHSVLQILSIVELNGVYAVECHPLNDSDINDQTELESITHEIRNCLEQERQEPQLTILHEPELARRCSICGDRSRHGVVKIRCDRYHLSRNQLLSLTTRTGSQIDLQERSHWQSLFQATHQNNRHWHIELDNTGRLQFLTWTS